jgi:beta-aspartyl-peptidase (threonine type)
MKFILTRGLILCLALPFFVNGQNHEQFQFDGAAILIHGGAGGIERKYYTDEQVASYDSSLRVVLNVGYKLLEEGCNGMDVVVHCLTLLEDNPLFNAGKGAVVTAEGTIEAKLARDVMEYTPHVLLIGDGAESFAQTREHEFVENSYFLTAKRKVQYQRWKEIKKNGTVGVVLKDANGDLYAGTSTGGMMGKQYGRVGDVPLIGAGTYADNRGAAVSCTGHGEYFIRENVAFQVNARMQFEGLTLEESASRVIFGVLNEDAGNGGLIAIDAKGNATWTFNSKGMFRGAKGKMKTSEKVMLHTDIFGDPTWPENCGF